MVTSNEQLVPGCSSPPEKDRLVGPDMTELAPQGVEGKLLEVNELIIELRLWVNCIDVAARAEAALVMVYRRIILLPGKVGLVTN